MQQASCHDCFGTSAPGEDCNVVSPNGRCNASVAVTETEPGRVVSISSVHQWSFSPKYRQNVILIYAHTCTVAITVTVGKYLVCINAFILLQKLTSVLIQWHMGNVSIHLNNALQMGREWLEGLSFETLLRWLGICLLLAVCTGPIATLYFTHDFHIWARNNEILQVRLSPKLMFFFSKPTDKKSVHKSEKVAKVKS